MTESTLRRISMGSWPLPAEPTVAARWARLVVDLLETKQIAFEGVLREVGLLGYVADPDALSGGRARPCGQSRGGADHLKAASGD